MEFVIILLLAVAGFLILKAMVLAVKEGWRGPSASNANGTYEIVNNRTYIHTKVVGVTFANEDGTSRQKYIEECHVGLPLSIQHTPTDEFPEAMSVFGKSLHQIGFVNKELAVDLLNKHELKSCIAYITEITGGGEYPYGVNMKISL